MNPADTWEDRRLARKAARSAKFAAAKDSRLKNHYVYWAYDEQGRTLYIGCSRNLHGRWLNHKRQSAWPELAVSYKILGPFNYRTAIRLESTAQIAENPIYGMTPLNRDAVIAHSHLRLTLRLQAGRKGLRMTMDELALAADSICPSPLDPITHRRRDAA